MIDLIHIRERIQEAIKQSGYTQTAIAKGINVHHSAIGQYLSGRSLPALDTFANLCKFLDVDPAYILCLTE